ncbi:MAG: ral secretory system protein domain protein [Deltaproteobacteria bacterium]|nr:ral secretory system protein domain protein [Deltaproteobacteria bacterium]
MPSRLSSLLVRDGLVGVKRMEKAFQRQVIYGGSLDTILLEMSLVPEERLTQYLALASGLPPAARDEGQVIDPAATAVIPRELAEQYRAVPVAAQGETVRILVCAPLELTELEDLADQIDRPLQPLITPEYRWHLVYAAAYGLDPPARFTTLARSLEVDPSITPVGRARSVIVDAVDSKPGVPMAVADEQLEDLERTPRLHEVVRVLAPVSPHADTMKLASPVEAVPDPHRARTQTLVGVQPNRASTDSETTREGVPDEPAGRPGLTFLAPSSGVPRPVAELGSTRRQTAVVRFPRAATAPISTEGRDSPLPIVRARELLATAEDRDTVFLTLLRAARSRTRWAGLLTVQGGAAIGRVALAEPGLDVAAVNTVLIPLDSVSAFRTVVSNHQPHVGPLVSGDPGIDSMLLRLGGTTPPAGLILPIVLRDRVVAIVVAHRVHNELGLADITELLPLATAASDALGRLIVKHKAAGYRTPSEPAVVEIAAEQVDTKRLVRSVANWRAPSEPVSNFELGMEMSIEADPPRPIEDVLAAIEGAREGNAEDAISEAVERAHEVIGTLMRRFPGKLRVERFSVTGRPLRAAQYGGLLELVVRLGSVSSELLLEKMNAPQRDVRFYATVCCAELRPRNAVFALAERLFDQDFGVRACAIEALAGYPVQDLGQALARARRAVHSNDPEMVGAAATAIVELGDVEAIADLIGVIERADRGGEHARRALVALTAQDFGPSEKKWRKWHEAARNRHRIEWLIEGLSHKEDKIRETSINDLRRLTGEYFGYHHDLPRRERELAAERWATWWREAGHRRFMNRVDERHRPTALLPTRPRDPS